MSGKSSLTPAEEADILRLYADEELRLTMEQVAGKTGRTLSQVRRVIRQAGISRPRGRAALTGEEAARIISACTPDGGQSRVQIAAALGRSLTAVGKVLRRAELTAQPDGKYLLATQAAQTAGISADDLGQMARAGVVSRVRLTAHGRWLYSRADCQTIAAMRADRQASPEENVPPAARSG